MTHPLKGRKQGKEHIAKRVAKLKGQKRPGTAWNFGKKTGLVPKSAFNKGNVPWNAGTAKGSINSNGYRMISYYVNGKKHNIFEHRKVWINNKQSLIPKGFDIHHINGDKLDNQIGNLELIEHGVHSRLHNSFKGDYNE